MSRVGIIVSVVVAVLVLMALPGCESRGSDGGGSSSDYNAVLKGGYWFLDLSRGSTPTIAPDVRSRAGLAYADGMGMLVYGPGVGSPSAITTLGYRVDSLRRINGTSDEPGATIRNGEFFALGDLNRNDDFIGLGLYSRAATSLTVSTLVDKTTSVGLYHSVFYMLKRPGADVGRGTTKLTWQSDTTASWEMDLSLSASTTLKRTGTIEVASDGALIARDTVTRRNYIGYADPLGDWIVWAEIDNAFGRVVTLDVLVRKGAGLSDAVLNGRFNVLGYLEFNRENLADTIYGNISFNGRGAYFDFQFRDSFGNQTPPNLTQQKYTVSGDGVVTLYGDINATGYVTRTSGRRWLVVPEVRPDTSIRIYFVTSR